MKETTFINQNKKKWAKFEKMSKSHQNDPDEMSRLFVELTDDLAYARTFYPKRSVRVYLNSLAQRVFHDLYKKKREPLSKFFKFWTTDLPLEMYRAQKPLLMAFVVFAIGMLIGIVSTIDNEDFLGAVIGYNYVDMAEQNIANGKPMNVYGEGSESLSFGMIAINNMKVALITFVLGIFFSLGSGVFLFFNAIMVGAFQWFYVVRGLTLASFLTIWIHGAFEIPAIILAAAAGITMGNGILFPGTLTRLQSLVLSAKRGIKIMIGVIPFILLAAFIEGFATRNTVITTHGDPIESEWPTELKWLFILSCFAIVLFYFVIYPIMVARKRNFDGKVLARPQYVEKKDVTLNKIKDVGGLFTDTFLSYTRTFGIFFKLFLISIPINILYVYLLFESIPFYEYMDKADPWLPSFIGRSYKIIQNLDVMFLWGAHFQLDLFLIQVFVFAFNAFNILFAFRIVIAKNLKFNFKSYILLFLKSIIPLLIGFAVIGMLCVKLPAFALLFVAVLSPVLFIWMIPLVISKGAFGKNLKQGFSKPWKAFGTGIGLFFALFITCGIVYIFVGLPIDMFKDMALEWFVLPIADNPKYVLIAVDAAIYIILSHLIFVLFLLGFSLLYHSILEQEEANGMFEQLKSFGTKSNIYETKDEGSY